MTARSLIPRLTDIIEAIERIRGELGDLPLEAFENDWRRQWLVERGIEIVSEASRHLTDEMKTRHPEIPWKKLAGIGMCCAKITKPSPRLSCGSWRASISPPWKKFAVKNWQLNLIESKANKSFSYPFLRALPRPLNPQRPQLRPLRLA